MTRRRKKIWLAAVLVLAIVGGGAVIASRQSQAPKPGKSTIGLRSNSRAATS